MKHIFIVVIFVAIVFAIASASGVFAKKPGGGELPIATPYICPPDKCPPTPIVPPPMD